jgi:glycosyltransferase involved in cell wall biosynthesis
MTNKTLSIIIPVYNEEAFIEGVIDEVVKADSLGLSKEIIIVNDGSTDLTLTKLNKIKAKYKSIEIINQEKNSGKGYALNCGFLKSRGDIVIVQDSDREYSPSDYPLLLTPFFKYGADVVYGSRLSTTQAHRVLFFWHYKLNQFLTFLSNILTNLNLTDMETGYKAFNGEIIRKIAPQLQSKRFGFEPEITARMAKLKGIKIFEVGISYSGRTYQEGKKISWKDGVLALWEIVKYNLFQK